MAGTDFKCGIQKGAGLFDSEEEAKRMVWHVPMAVIADRDIVVEIPGHAGQILEKPEKRRAGKLRLPKVFTEELQVLF